MELKNNTTRDIIASQNQDYVDEGLAEYQDQIQKLQCKWRFAFILFNKQRMAKMCLNLIAINFKFLQIGIYLHVVFYLMLCWLQKQVHTLKKTQKSLYEVPIWETHILWTFGLSLCQKTQKKSFLRKEVKIAYLGKWIWRWRCCWKFFFWNSYY